MSEGSEYKAGDRSEAAIREDERANIRECLYGKLIDLTWWGVPNAGDPGVTPRPWGQIREARSRGVGDALAVLDERDRRVTAEAHPDREDGEAHE